MGIKKLTKILISGGYEKLMLLNIKRKLWETIDKDKRYKKEVLVESIKVSNYLMYNKK